MKRILWPIGIVLLISLWWGCKDDDMIPTDFDPTGGDLESIAYNPQPYDLVFPKGFPMMEIPAENPLTVDGVELGRFLFYDPILSADSSMSCSSCHLPAGNFTDNLALSPGINGVAGKRSSMTLLDVGFFTKGLFWDGRVHTLEEQALLPVEDPLELNTTWSEVVDKLQRHAMYPEMFRKAFGILDRTEITKELAAKAIAQFERTLVSSGSSRFDRKFLAGEPFIDFTDSEFRGFDMFFDIPGSPLPDAQCFHCHDAPLFTNNEFFNNGLDEVATLDDFPDRGLGAVTGRRIDNGKFRGPSLRNIMLSAPYMHDGRFQTIEEVLDFYNEGIHYAENLDENLVIPLGLTESQKADIIAFLHTLTDTVALNNPAYSNPFE